MSAAFKVTELEPGIQAIGPFEISRIVIGGYEVPLLTGKLADGMWHFEFDNRFGLSVPEMYGHGVAQMIGDAMAVGAGYSCFGKNSVPLNRFKRRLRQLDVVSEIDAIETEGGEQ